MTDLTGLLEKAHHGDQNAWNLVYESAGPRLRSIAARLLRQEKCGHLYQPTALISESWMRLFRSAAPFRSRWHFYNLSARAMVQTLIDASRRNSHKIHRHSFPLDPTFDLPHHITRDSSNDVNLRLAFERMRRRDPLVAETIRLRLTEGYTIEETAAYQRRPVARVREDFGFGLKWLRDLLG
ncbi:MAG: hypothetical protein JNK87_08435 [Bryobacterales bacterium]|nr:hypothetical protein [Bryobacterales bacterium]